MKREFVSRIFREQPTLGTERLVLRRISPIDAEDMYDYAKNPTVTRYLTWEPHPAISHTREYIDYLETRYAVGDFFDWAVVERASGKMIGTCGFTRFRYEDDCGEIGYVLHPDAWGKGYAPEALREVLRFGFETLGLQRIEAKFMVENQRSLRVMQKIGMRLEGYQRKGMRIRGELRTVGCCAILSGEPFFEKL